MFRKIWPPAMADTTNRLPPQHTEHRLITCIMPAGRGIHILERLQQEKGIVSASVHHARGVSTSSLGQRQFYFAEKQLVVALVEAERADEIFDFLYHACGIKEKLAGMIVMERLWRAAPLALARSQPPFDSEEC